ncbi:uncharacterized protein LOC119456962 [Dermacentor silvarum]|uniref:uncharacterized protein LOC119456962 n=1 Tax=Dermacentor silvarum TaxID=543639 RepID=UPI0021007460|nr:uncharacterized protein LOC119456962 [Dermacentor silvarum]
MSSAQCLLLALLASLGSVTAPALRTDQITPGFSGHASHSPYNVSHGLQSDKKLEQPADELDTPERGNTSGLLSLLPSRRLPKSSKVVLNSDHRSMADVAARATGHMAGMRGLDIMREFFHTNQVLIYIACSFALTVLVLVFTLVTVYGGRRALSSDRSASSASWRRFAESYPLIDRRSLLVDQGSVTQRLLDSSDDDDEHEYVAVLKNEEEVDTSVAPPREFGDHRARSVGYAPSEISDGPWSASWSLPGDPPQVIIKSKQGVKRPIEVFPSRLLDLCNQDAPHTFLAFLPNGSQHRSKWIAHGRHSEVFQVASLLRRTVLKVVPVTGDFTEQQVDTIASAIQCCLKLSTLKHGTRYGTPNFIEVERIACVFDQFPEWLLRSGSRGLDSSSESLAESLASEMAGTDGSPDASDLLAAFRRWKGTNQCCLTLHFIVFELSYAGKPLSRITLRSALQGRSLVQQAACCVAVAERALGFRHTSVDADKLLVAVTDAACLEYRLPDRMPISVESAGLKAHLAGGLSFAVDPVQLNHPLKSTVDHPLKESGVNALVKLCAHF